MGTESLSLVKVYKRHIKNTIRDALVVDLTVYIGNLTEAVVKTSLFSSPKVYVTTRVLKHLYDRKPAEEFDAILRHLPVLIRYPNCIYQNRSGKKGDLCFTKIVGGENYFCSIEKRQTDDLDEVKKEEVNFVVTVFRVRKGDYLKNYQLLWSWKGDGPSS